MRITGVLQPGSHPRAELGLPPPNWVADNRGATDAALVSLCHRLETLLPKTTCAVMLLDGATGRVRRTVGPSLPPLFGSALDRATVWLPTRVAAPGADDDDAMPLVNAGRGLRPAPLAAFAREFGLDFWVSRSILDATLDRTIGALVIFRPDAPEPAASERAMIEEAADFASGILCGHPAPTTPPAVHAAADNAFRRMIETVPAIVYTQRVGASREIIYVSPQVEAILGWTPADYATPNDHWFGAILPIDQAQVRAAVTDAIARGAPLDIEYRVATRDGRVVWLRDMASLLLDPDQGARIWHGVQFDITADKAAEARLYQFAYYDSLTGLPNRRLCVDQLQEALSQPRRPPIALLFLDLDRFKVINDGIGHAAGDDLLVAVARRLSAQVAGRGSLARFGGDEFVAVMAYRVFEEVEALAAALLDALRRPYLVDGYELIVEGTIGIAVASPDLATPEALLQAADVALYRAKGDGGNTVALHDPAIDRQSPDHLEHEADLRRGLLSGEFRIDYQPVVDVDTGRYLAVEALLRWNHPRRGLLPPAEFIDLADETGLIVPLGQWALAEACRQMRCWQERYPTLRTLRVSVNLSGRQLRQASLVADVALALEQSGLAPEHLALEIQEGDAIADPGAISQAMREFRRLGVKVTIDGFGKGWGALGALTQFAIDDLKIDGACISRLGQRQQDAGVVRALVGMAKTMGLAVTAGAVETDEQLALVRELGCNGAQGRHLAPPLSVDEIETLFHQRAGAAGDHDFPGPPSQVGP